MKEIFRGCPGKSGEHRRWILMVFLVLVFLIAGTAGLGLTKEKAQPREVRKINTENVRPRNIGCDMKELNPLRKDEHPEINRAVAEYFEGLKEGETFVEKYDDLHVYTKVGQYKGTYIVFAEYRMGIKDIYTEVPGLVTLYALTDEKSGQYRIVTENPEGQEEECVRRITEHTDVQELIRQAEDEFDLAVRSDALLREAISDLKDAYGAYAG